MPYLNLGNSTFIISSLCVFTLLQCHITMRPKRRKTQAAITLEDEAEDLTPGSVIIYASRAGYWLPYGLGASKVQFCSTVGQKLLVNFLPFLWRWPKISYAGLE